MEAYDYVGEFSRILGMLESREWPVDFDKAEVALAVMHELAKDRRMRLIDERGKNAEEPATEKQRKFMRDLEIEFDGDITKREASERIDAALDKG